MFTAADLRYDAEAHRTWRADGVEVPHVTAVLSAVGVCADFDDLVASGGPRGRAIEHARLRGTAVHMDCHAYDDNDLDWATADPRIVPYVEAWAQVRETYRLVPISRERQVYHPTFVYTGILDGVFRIAPTPERRVLIDLKTGNPDDAAAHLQTAAYAEAWRAMHGDDEALERWAVWLRPGRTVPYTIVNYSTRPEAAADFGKFLACLTVYHEQASRRGRIQ